MATGGNSPDQTNYFNGWAHASPGLGSVGSYQIAGTPYMSGSTDIDDGDVDTVVFPAVTRRVLVRNTSTSGSLRVHFGTKGEGRIVNGFHYITLQPIGHLSGVLSQLDMEVKCDHLFVSNDSGKDNCSYEVFAELTGINRSNMFHLTGSGVTE
jgi:hypothetical protein